MQTDVQPLGENSELLAMIDRQAVDELDRQILSAVASLNRHINKTNFYKRDTSAISLRLDPSFMTAGMSALRVKTSASHL